MKTFSIQQKITVLANQYFIYEFVDDNQKLVAFAQQKRFAFKEKISFYTDESKKDVAFEVQARSAIDLGARYDVKDASGNVLGVVGKAFGSSLLRSTWNIFGDGEKEPAIIVQERSMAVAIARRVWELVPIAESIPFFVKYHFDFLVPGNEQPVATYEKRTTLRDNYELKVVDEDILQQHDWRVLVALGVMMDALQSR